MRNKEAITVTSILILSALAAEYLPGLLDMPTSMVQERMLLLLFPIFLLFIWWVW